MWEKIEKMRNREYGERKRMTLFVSIVVTALIAFVWSTAVLPRTFTLSDDGTLSAAITMTPFQTFKEDAGLIWGDIIKSTRNLGDQINEIRGTEEEEGPLPAKEGEMPSSRGDELPAGWTFGDDSEASLEVLDDNTEASEFDIMPEIEG